MGRPGGRPDMTALVAMMGMSAAGLGALLHAALVLQPGSCIRRLGGTRAREMRFTRLLRNRSVTVEEMSRHAGTLTGGRAAGREVVAIQDTSELALGAINDLLPETVGGSADLTGSNNTKTKATGPLTKAVF